LCWPSCDRPERPRRSPRRSGSWRLAWSAADHHAPETRITPNNPEIDRDEPLPARGRQRPDAKRAAQKAARGASPQRRGGVGDGRAFVRLRKAVRRADNQAASLSFFRCGERRPASECRGVRQLPPFSRPWSATRRTRCSRTRLSLQQPSLPQSPTTPRSLIARALVSRLRPSPAYFAERRFYRRSMNAYRASFAPSIIGSPWASSSRSKSRSSNRR
jgi:hypothetical protein